MDLNQRKLTKDEWRAIEIKLPEDELEILGLFGEKKSVSTAQSGSVSSFADRARVDASPPVLSFLYEEYFAAQIKKVATKYGLEFKESKGKCGTIKQADRIRLKNTERTLMKDKETIYEFMVVELMTVLLRSDKKGAPISHTFYTADRLFNAQVERRIPQVDAFARFVMDKLRPKVNVFDLVCDCGKYVERNGDTLKFRKKQLYPHQRAVLSHIARPGPKLILYTAPTGTGKTMTPIGIIAKKRVIFVCAARHVGLALAKAAVSMERRIAFAFGCNDVSDIRLHYFAAKEYTKNYRSGGIYKVDNSVGDNVELMICDIQSYSYAMHYMAAFNAQEELVLYWDEPTITLDYDQHPLHEIIESNWRGSIVPNVVLSSATLPSVKELQNVTSEFQERFPGAQVFEVSSYDCTKSISLLSKDNLVALPHLLFEEYSKVKRACAHCRENKSLMRYLDSERIGQFIRSANQTESFTHRRFAWDVHFSEVSDVTLENIKLYYLLLLDNIDGEKWPALRDLCLAANTPRYESSIRMATEDAHTLTDGPTIFIAEDVGRIGKYCLQSSKIPKQIIEELHQAILFNNALNGKITKIEQEIDAILQKDEEKDAKKAKSRMPPEARQLQEQLESLRSGIKTVKLHEMFVPNTSAHRSRWAPDSPSGDACVPDVPSSDIERIMMINDVDDMWKILLMMGIGVFKEHTSPTYSEIMKGLAQSQKLYLVIASGDYIYGTNYQFCHGYIGQDLSTMSQEKLIQAIGRVGRKSVQKTYTVRFRDDRILEKLFIPSEDTPEAANMNRLLGRPL